MEWGECFGHQGVFPGKCCQGMSEEGSVPRARVQQGRTIFRWTGRCWAEKSPEVSVTGTQLHLLKSTFQGICLDRDELARSMHHHHSTGCPKENSLWGEDCPVASLLTERDQTLGSYFLMQSIYFFFMSSPQCGTSEYIHKTFKDLLSDIRKQNATNSLRIADRLYIEKTYPILQVSYTVN